MSKLDRLVPLILLLACFVSTPEALADDVGITNGHFTSSRDSFTFDLRGLELRIEGAGGITDNSIGPSFCAPCTDGGSLDSIASGSDISGEITYQGQTYNIGIGTADASTYLEFIGGNFVIPAEFRNSHALLFTSLFGFNGSFFIPRTLEPRVGLSGSGVTRLLLVEDFAPGFFRLERLEYEFLAPGAPRPPPSVEAIPEPTTMLLLGTGLAGIGMKLRKRRKAQAE